jgi:hypothetical protein
VTQVVPLHRTACAQALPPVHAMWFAAALVVTPDAQLDGPVQSTVQLFPPQATAPWQAPSPEQVMVAVSPPPETVEVHESVPLHVTSQVPVPPPQWIGCEQAWSAHVTVHAVAPRQSIGVLHPPAEQMIRQGIPIGQTTGPAQCAQGPPHTKTQVPAEQAPPAARQLAQFAPMSGDPQTEGTPASVPRTPPAPESPPAAGAPPVASPPVPGLVPPLPGLPPVAPVV